MRAAKLLGLAGAFVGSSLFVIIGCGGESGSQPATNTDKIPAILTAPTQIANLQDGGVMTLRLLPSATGGVQGQAIVFPPKGAAGERPVLLKVTGTSTDMSLVSLAEEDNDVDYRLVGSTNSNGIFNANLLAGPGASPGDEPPQALGFARMNRSKGTPSTPSLGRAQSYATARMTLLGGPDVYRFRFQPGVLVSDDYGFQTYDVGYRVCLDCDGKFNDYAGVYASYIVEAGDWISLYFHDANGEVAWGTMQFENGKVVVDSSTDETFFVERSAHNSDTEFGTFTNIQGVAELLNFN